MSTSVQDWRRAAATATTTVPTLALSLGASQAPKAASKGRLIYGESNSRSLEFVRKRDTGSPARIPGTPPHQPETTATAPASPTMRPALVRKKSGELVKSSLKLPQLPRTKSLPNTKNVHFAGEENLVDVRRFNRLERPASVSLSESDTTDSSDEEDDEWVMTTPNWNSPKYEGTDRPPVYLESVILSGEMVKSSILVKNIGFSKRVVVRYSSDYWKSVAEIEAKYTDDIKRKDRQAGYDRFTWTLPINALPLWHNSYNATPIFFAIRYTVNHQELWDNNSGLNYELSFRGSSAEWETLPAPVQRSQPEKPRLHRMPSFLAENPQGTPKLQSDSENPFKSRYSFGTASSTPASTARFGSKSKPQQGPAESYEDILQRYCFYTPHAPVTRRGSDPV